MDRALDLHGMAAVDYIVCRFGGGLVANWDGGTDRVGFIIHNGDDQRAQVGFWLREDAPSKVRFWADLSPRNAPGLREIASALAETSRPSGVQCVIIGPDGGMLVEINPDDLRPALGPPPTNEDLADMLDRCLAQERALSALGEVRLFLHAELGHYVVELADLEAVLTDRWSDLAAIDAAAARARKATDEYVPTPAGQRARLFLNMLTESFERRRPEVNTRGGVA